MYNQVALTNAQLVARAPSIFATHAHDSRSDRYTYIPTAQLLEAMAAEDFLPFNVREARVRHEDKRGFARHMIRFRKASDIANWATKTRGEAIPEVVLVNSHDGSSSYKMYGGIFRIICLNGMVVGDGHIESVRIPHKGDVIQQVIEGAYRVLGQVEKVTQVHQTWGSIALSTPERLALAESAHMVRFPSNEEGEQATPFTPKQLLVHRRQEDNRSDLWTTFNVIQENCIKGGLKATTIREAGKRPRRVSTREVKNIGDDVKLNRALWALAEKMAALKLAA